MKILITGAGGFVGQNLQASLENLRDRKDQVHKIRGLEDASQLQLFTYDINNTLDELEQYCREVDFVFHLAGVNRPEDPEEFMKGNFGFSSTLLNTLKKYNNTCPVMLSSSVQASLQGRFAGSKYGKSKLAGEELFRNYSEETGARVIIYRLPNLFGKWSKPNYNSAVATFCNNIANDLPIQVNDRSIELDLVYIDDLIQELRRALDGEEHRDETGYCYVPEVHHVTLGEVVDLLLEYKASRKTGKVPYMASGSFSKKLYATFLTYISPNNLSYCLKKNSDDRGSFTEILRTADRGQFSVNISKPGIIKGQHWHHTKNEKFVVVSGTGLIQLRRVGINKETKEPYPVIEFSVNGKDMTVIDVIPGYTHNIINTSDSEDLITFIWCNECFDPEYPDTFYEEVETV